MEAIETKPVQPDPGLRRRATMIVEFSAAELALRPENNSQDLVNAQRAHNLCSWIWRHFNQFEGHAVSSQFIRLALRAELGLLSPERMYLNLGDFAVTGGIIGRLCLKLPWIKITRGPSKGVKAILFNAETKQKVREYLLGEQVPGFIVT